MSGVRIRPSILVFLAALNAAALIGYWVMGRQNSGPVKVHGPAATSGSFAEFGLPEFTLFDSTGREVTRTDFNGRPWVFDFIYTDCPAQCPMMTTKMSALRQALPADVGFASVSVNPEKDSPTILAGYAKRYGADTANWLFLTGAKDQIAKLQTALGAPSGSTLDSHSVRFYLVDRDGRLAGAYDTTQEKAIRFLSRDARQLAGEAGGEGAV